MSIRSFLVTIADGVTYIITGGGEGRIRIWKYDVAGSKFDMLSVLEGHIREVTCLYLHGKKSSYFVFAFKSSTITTFYMFNMF